MEYSGRLRVILDNFRDTVSVLISSPPGLLLILSANFSLAANQFSLNGESFDGKGTNTS